MKQNIDITHLVTNGCSWTYCQGLESPELTGWPRLLANKFGIKVVNLALMGCGNQSIQRRNYEYVLKNLSTNSKPFFIVAWSQYWRQETWDNDINDYCIIHGPDKLKTMTLDQEYILNNWNDEDHLRRILINKSSTKTLFNALKIPYVMSDFANCLSKIDDKIKKKLLSFTNFNDDQYCVDYFYDICKNSSITPCMHYGLDGQHMLADYLYDKINSLYNINVIKNAEFLTLRDYKIQNNFKSCWDYF